MTAKKAPIGNPAADWARRELATANKLLFKWTVIAVVEFVLLLVAVPVVAWVCSPTSEATTVSEEADDYRNWVIPATTCDERTVRLEKRVQNAWSLYSDTLEKLWQCKQPNSVSVVGPNPYWYRKVTQGDCVDLCLASTPESDRLHQECKCFCPTK